MTKKATIILVLILLTALILRFYRLSETYVFGFDEEYQATYAWTLVNKLHPIWIGVSASFLDFYLGPYFTYFTAFLLAISKGDPILTAYFAAALGVATTAMIFFAGWKVFSFKIGVISSFLYGGLPFFVFYDQKYWNTMFTSFLTVLLFLTLYLLKKHRWFLVLYAAIFGIVLQTHLEPAPFLLIGIWYFLKGKYWQDIKLMVVSLLVFLVFYWPLLVFDYNHNFSNLTIFNRFAQGITESKINFNLEAKLKTLFDSMGRFWYLKQGNPNADEINISCTSLSTKQEFSFIDQYAKRTSGLMVFSILTLFLLLVFSRFSLQSRLEQIKLLGIFLLVGLLSFIFFPGGSSEYYTLSFFTLFVFVPAILINQQSKKVQVFLLGLVFFAIFFGIRTVLSTSDEFSLAPKKRIIKEVMEVVGEKSFAIEGRGICHNWEGWRYLFKVYGRVPDKSYTDSNLGWLYPEEIGTKTPIYTIILSEDRIPLKEDLSTYLSIKEGGYRAYIRKTD